jgi:hypothetical protein
MLSKNISDSLNFHSKWPSLLKTENSLNYLTAAFCVGMY